MNVIASMLSDGAGNTSTTRVILFLFTLYLLITHAALTIHAGAAQPFGSDELTLLGILFGTKLVQNQQEKTEGTENKNPVSSAPSASTK